MDAAILGAKSLLAVMLVIAGGAKLADLAGFAATTRLFMPWRVPRAVIRGCALGIALAELGLGAASLSSPSVGWLNPVIFTLACGFVGVSAVGYAFYRGRSCRCFGALSQRKFDVVGILRSVAIAAVAAIAMSGVRVTSVQVGGAERGLLAAAAIFLGLIALTAARVLSESRGKESRLTVR
jgi:hypothetical protein